MTKTKSLFLFLLAFLLALPVFAQDGTSYKITNKGVVKSVVENTVGPEALFVLLVHQAVFSRDALKIGNRINHC